MAALSHQVSAVHRPTALESRGPSVLILIPESAQAQPLASFIQGVEDELTQAAKRTLIFAQTVPLTVDSSKTKAWLEQRFDGMKFDAIVVYGAAPLSFALSARDKLWPGVPILFAGVTPNSMPSLRGQHGVYGQLMPNGVGPTLNLATRLFPSARRLAVLGPEPGDPMLPDFWELADSNSGGRKVERLAGLPLQQLKQRIASLPPDTVLALMGPARDPETHQLLGVGAMRELLTASPVPVVSGIPALFGDGIVGGAPHLTATIGHSLGKLTKQMLIDHRPPAEPITESPDPPLNVDWRVLHKLGVDARKLPPNAVIEFQSPSLWEAYRIPLLTGLGVVLLQSLVLMALLVERQQRQRAQKEATQRLSELAHQQRVHAVGVLSLTLAHELNQPLGAMLASAETVDVLMERPDVPRQQVLDAVKRIYAANQLAVNILKSLRRLVKKMPQVIDVVSMDDLLAEVALLLRPEAQRRSVRLRVEAGSAGFGVRADAAQLEQVVLNLVLNAMDAMRDTPAVEREVLLLSRHDQKTDRIHLQVSDRGHGFDSATAARLFDSFYTTKPEGLGLGLSIAKGLVQSHGGSLNASQRPGGGASFEIILPAVHISTEAIHATH